MPLDATSAASAGIAGIAGPALLVGPDALGRGHHLLLSLSLSLLSLLLLLVLVVVVVSYPIRRHRAEAQALPPAAETEADHGDSALYSNSDVEVINHADP